MEGKQVLCVIVLLALMFEHRVLAEFYYNRVEPKAEDLGGLGLKCIPGRTIIKIEPLKVEDIEGSSDEDEIVTADTRRTHMNAQPSDENCNICVCSVDGKDEYCSKRPARNVNECIRMSTMMVEFKKNIPFDHEKSLSHMIRRDYIWHKDEIPYDPHAKCKRGFSYYSNSVNANDTDIDAPTDIDSLLDYSNKNICFFCICSVSGNQAGCINRDPWFCEYYRIIKQTGAARDIYRDFFKQDRPAYFRQLSHRLRRTMDDGIYSLLDSGGDTLCCEHPDGHRRNLHRQVRNRIRQLKRKITKENLMSGHPGGDYVDFIVNND